MRQLVNTKTKLHFDNNNKMIYFILHSEQIFVAWLIEDIIRNTRNFVYKQNEHLVPEVVKLQIESMKIFDESESFNP